MGGLHVAPAAKEQRRESPAVGHAPAQILEQGGRWHPARRTGKGGQSVPPLDALPGGSLCDLPLDPLTLPAKLETVKGSQVVMATLVLKQPLESRSLCSLVPLSSWEAVWETPHRPPHAGPGSKPKQDAKLQAQPAAQVQKGRTVPRSLVGDPPTRSPQETVHSRP